MLTPKQKVITTIYLDRLLIDLKLEKEYITTNYSFLDQKKGRGLNNVLNAIHNVENTLNVVKSFPYLKKEVFCEGA